MADDEEPKKGRARKPKTEAPAEPPAGEAGGEGDDGSAGVGALVPAGPDGDGGTDLATLETEPPSETVVIEREPMTQRDRNRLVYGRVVVHFPERDVEFVLDGDAALRLMAIHARRDRPWMDDRLRPESSKAANLWISLDVQRALAMTWIPTLKERSLTTIDPEYPADDA